MREDVESADTMLAQLSELLRGTLRTEGVQEVPLSEELRLLRAYLAIQQTRFGDRLQIDIDVPNGCLGASSRRSSFSRWWKTRSAMASARRLVPAASPYASRPSRGVSAST